MIHVVAAAVTDHGGRVLIAERPAGKPMAGYWEFPGGKLEPGENRPGGLARELREELGISIRSPRPLMRLRHRYDFGEVLIDLWVVSQYDGEPRPLEGQRLRWCALDELDGAGLLPADKPLVRALRLPERLRKSETSHYFIENLARPPEPVLADPVDRRRLMGTFCRSAAEVSMAVEAGTQFIVLTNPLSDQELTDLCRQTSVPVFAKGVTLQHAWALGASGVGEIEI